jgi:hypothetical protein
MNVYHGYKKLARVEDICRLGSEDRLDAALLLELHGVTASFWQHVRSAIQYMRSAFENAPFDNPTTVPDALNDKWSKLNALSVPKTTLDYYGRVETFMAEKLYRRSYPKDWRSFTSDMEHAWWRLYSWLQDVDTPRDSGGVGRRVARA